MSDSAKKRLKKKLHNQRQVARIELMGKAVEHQSAFRLTSLDGCLAFPQYGLLFPPNMMKETTHALGTQHKTKERGVYHGVVSPEVAATISMEEFEVHQKLSLHDYTETEQHKLPVPGDANTIEILKVEWAAYRRIAEADDESIKGKNPNRTEVLTFTLVVPSTDCDVFSVLLEPKLAASDYHMGAQVFLKPHTPLVNSPVADKLLDDLLKHTVKKGIEVSRQGGALGRCDPQDKTFRDFISRNNMCPRLGSASLLVIVNSTTRSGFYVIYRSPYTGKMVAYFYNTPRIGGHQTLKTKQLEDHGVLRRFPWCRVKSCH